MVYMKLCDSVWIIQFRIQTYLCDSTWTIRFHRQNWVILYEPFISIYRTVWFCMSHTIPYMKLCDSTQIIRFRIEYCMPLQRSLAEAAMSCQQAFRQQSKACASEEDSQDKGRGQHAARSVQGSAGHWPCPWRDDAGQAQASWCAQAL